MSKTSSLKNTYSNFKKILLCKNSKIPAQKEWQKNLHTTIDTKYYNVGIPCGIINNLLGFDIDEKDNGIKEFKKYTDEFGEPNTVKQVTPNNGVHLFFKVSHSNPICKNLIDTYLTNKTKFRGCGLDIRTNGGYLVAAPSVINNKTYVFERSFDKCKVLEMPESLIRWLIVGQDNRKNNNSTIIPKICGMTYLINDDEIIKLLDKLPLKYLNEYNSWLIILSILKNMNKWDIFNEWSKKSNKYNYNNNINLWNNNNGKFNINYISYILLNECKIDIPVIEGVKQYTPLTKDINFSKINMNNKYMFDTNYKEAQFTKQIFEDNDTIIIKSTTGTGKTTSVASHCSDGNSHIISIVPRISLANQHVKSFNDKGVKMLSYLEEENSSILDINNDNIVICINSLLKLQNLSMNVINNSVIFIDEITSFLETLTHNELLNNKMKQINNLLIKLIKNAKKVIVSDALINDNVLEFLKYRSNETKIYIENNFIKFKGVNAVRIRDENLFLKKLQDEIILDKPFFCCSDSCKEISKMFLKLYKEAPLQLQEKFILITADTQIKIMDATKELQNKFVFYSPSITYGLDFQSYEPQNVFNYIKGESIEPSGFFQQVTRTRNINTLYYYCQGDCSCPQYDNLQEVKDHYSNIVNICNNNMYNICVSVNENDDVNINENLYYNLFCYNEYIFDIYHTNKLKHFEFILSNNGFVLSEDGDVRTLSKEDNDDMKESLIEYKNELFDEFISLPSAERQQPKFNAFNTHIDTFKLNEKNDINFNEIKQCITNKFYFKEILNYNRLLKNDNFIKSKIMKESKENYDIKNYKSQYKKIQLLQEILKNNNMKIFELECSNDTINFSNEILDKYKIIFVSPKATQPTTSTELVKLIVNTYKLLMPNLEFIKTDIVRIQNKDGTRKRVYKYSIIKESIDKINDILKIYGFNKKDEAASNINDICKIDFIDDDIIINNNVLSQHEFYIGGSLFKYSMVNNITTCHHCNKNILDVYSHCCSCNEFKLTSN